MRIINILFLVASWFISFSQDIPGITRYETNDLGAQHQNWMITKDCEGRLFVANSAGVLVFNGFKWQLIPLPQNRKARSVFKGNDCRMYVGGYEIFGYIDPQTLVYTPLGDSILGGSTQEIWSIMGNSESIVFQSFSDLFKFDYHYIEKIPLPGNIMLGHVLGNEFYIPKIIDGLYTYDGKQLLEMKVAQTLPANSKIIGIENNYDNQIVLATQNTGLFLSDHSSIYPANNALNQLLQKEQINKMIQLTSGGYAIGTILNGLFIIDSAFTIKYHIYKGNGLSNNTVLSLFEDEVGDLWVGLDKGINLIRLSSPALYHYDLEGKLGTLFANVFYQDTLYLATNQGVFRSNGSGNFNLIPGLQDQAWSFLLIGDNLLCGHNSGTYNILNGKAHKITDVTGGLHMTLLDDSTVLQSTYTGFILLHKSFGQWSVKARIPSANFLIEDFILDHQTLVGCGMHNDIYVIQFAPNFETILNAKKFTHLDGNPIHKDASLLNSSIGMLVLNDNKLYKASDSLITPLADTDYTCLLPADAVAKELKRKLSKAVDGFVSDSRKKFDLTSGQTKDLIFLNFDQGYFTIKKDELLKLNTRSDISVEWIEIEELKIKPQAGRSIKGRQGNCRIQLRSKFIGQQNRNIKYRLNNSSYSLPEDGTINLINLDDGQYQLYILNDTDEKLILEFTITPNWYESLPGILLYALFTLTISIFVYKRQLKKYAIERQKIVNEQERKMEEAKILSKNKELENELIYKSKMLANSAFSLAQKNQMLMDLKEVVEQDEQHAQSKSISQLRQKVLHLIDLNINNQENWQLFESHFAEVHQDFLNRLKIKHPELTGSDLKLAAYIRTNLSSKEISPLFNISLRSVENKRYRLRKKLGLQHEDNLIEYLIEL